MSGDILLEIESVKGESARKQNHIDVLSWSWGAHNHGSMHHHTGGGSGKVDVSDLTLTKHIDKASTDLILACCNGKHYPKAKMTVHKADGEKTVEYFTLKLTDVFITGWTTGGSQGQDLFTETVTLNFAKFEIEYKSQSKDGKGTVAGNMGWDIAKREKV